MELDEMKKIWDEQNQEPLYAINEAALYRSIQSKKKGASRLTNFNDFGLVAVCIITAIVYVFIAIINETPSIYDYLIIIALMFIAGYIWTGRMQRKKKERRFDRTMLGDLDHAIASVKYEVKRSRTMPWWFLLPLAILVVLNMSTAEDISLWKWLGISAGFVLSYLLFRWEYRYRQKPKEKRLRALRDKLMKEETMN